MARDSESTLVYSSEGGLVRPVSSSTRKTNSAPKTATPPADGTVRLQRQTKGRGGGTVIVITGITLAESALKELAGVLKKRCGCGGTVKGGVVEIQGDHRDKIQQELVSRGYTVKLAGG
jgi:translation initiation factor 1